MYIYFAIVVALSAGLGSSQSDCSEITEASLEDVITDKIPTGQNPTLPTVNVLSFRTVCLAYSQERDRYRFVSVVVEYTCTGNPNCPSGTAVEQFESQCSSRTWSHSVLGDVDNTRTVNPTASFSTTTRKDCAFCLSPLTASGFGLTTDTVTHCVACHSSCNGGLMRCYGWPNTQCCSYYNASTCVDTCPSPRIPDDEYNCVCPSGYTGYNCSQIQLCPDLDIEDDHGIVEYSSETQSDSKGGPVVSTPGYSDGTNATVTCDEGYRTSGSSLICHNGSWSGKVPECTTCEVKNCSVCDGDHKTCEQCNTGYELSNNECISNNANSIVSTLSRTVSTTLEAMLTPTGSSKPTNTDCSHDNKTYVVVIVVLAVLVVLLAAALAVSLIVVYRLHGSNRQSVSSAIPVDDNVAYSELKVKVKASEPEVASPPQYEEIAVKK